jgi:hypothetical protein
LPQSLQQNVQLGEQKCEVGQAQEIANSLYFSLLAGNLAGAIIAYLEGAPVTSAQDALCLRFGKAETFE